MKKEGEPVRDFELAKAALDDYNARLAGQPLPDFSDTERTFAHFDDDDLQHARRMFSLMGKPWLTSLMGILGKPAVRFGIPGATWAVKHTVYRQFVGGTSLIDALATIESLYDRNVTSILDYGAEAKNTPDDYNDFLQQTLRAIDFSAEAPAANAVVVKLTALGPDDLLARLNDVRINFEQAEDSELSALVRRLDTICARAAERGVHVYLDAEESWYQATVDQFADRMMRRYNRDGIVVHNTFQLYRHDRLAFLKASHARARAGGYRLGTKLVRGAYLVKENARATELGYPTPIQPTLTATHRDFNAALRYCLEHHAEIGTCVGTHNEESIRLMTEWMVELEIPRDHPNLRSAQLLGMSDNVTFNLAAGGYNASKYLVYGPVKEVLPYLIRRAEENTSVTGEAGRELRLIDAELHRRRRIG